MASIQKHGARWRVQVYANGVRDSKVCASRQEASAWALERTAELTGKKLPNRTLVDAMKRYGREVSPTHLGSHWELLRLTALGRDPMAKRRLSGLAATDFSDWRDRRLTQVAPGTVLREMNLLHSVLESCRTDWGWLRINPLQDVTRPKPPSGRKRRVTGEEVTAVAQAFGVDGALVADLARNRIGLAFLFALETAMRSGEIVAMRWADVRLAERFVILPRTKNGDAREVPLSTRAAEILKALPVEAGPVFGLDDAVRDTLWRKHRPAELVDLHFHDSRSEAIWRLSKKLDVLQLARMIGHRDINSLMIYYRESAADMAKRLD